MATLKGQTIAASYQDLVKRADTYSQAGTNIELMTDTDSTIAPTGLYLESGATTDNVGIGVADPDQALEVAGKIHISNEGSAPSAPAAGDGGIIYTKADGKPYWISDDVADVALTNTVAVSADLDYGGYYSLDEQGRTDHVANTMPAPYYRFDGSNDKTATVNTNDINDLAANDTITMAAWINPTATSTEGIMGYGGVYMSICVNGGYLEARNYDAGNGGEQLTNTDVHAITAGEWCHVAGVFTGGNVTLYKNGVATAANSCSNQAANDNAIHVGFGGASDYFGGSIAGASFWNKALTATEVKELYSGASVPYKYKGASQTELMPDQVDRDFSGASSWANVTYGGNYHESGDLSLQSNGVDQYCTLPVADAPTTIGKRYRVSVDFSLVAADKTFTIQSFDGTQDFGTFSATGTGQTFEFTAETTGGYRVKADHSGSAGDFNNFSLTQIGATIEYDGSSATEGFWYDKSGNDLDGTVTGATLENRVSALVVDDRVGIGTTPATQLHIRDDAAEVRILRLENRNDDDNDLTLIDVVNTDIGATYKPIAFGCKTIDADNREGSFVVAVADTDEVDMSTDIRMTIDNAGDVTFTGDLIMADGKGIDFSADASPAAGMTAEILDDYEEGTWTGAITAATGTITINSSFDTFSYTKVGRVVHIEGRARITSVSTPSGALAITGLPFTSASVGEDGSQSAISFYLRGAASAVNSCVGSVGTGTTTVELFENGTTGAGNDMADHIDAGSFIMIGGSYVAA